LNFSRKAGGQKKILETKKWSRNGERGQQEAEVRRAREGEDTKAAWPEINLRKTKFL